MNAPASEPPSGIDMQANKRARVDADSCVEGVVNAALLSDGSRKALREAFRVAEPFTHCVFEQPFDAPLLRNVRDEIINNIEATYKETDLFKVFQTGECAHRGTAPPPQSHLCNSSPGNKPYADNELPLPACMQHTCMQTSIGNLTSMSFPATASSLRRPRQHSRARQGDRCQDPLPHAPQGSALLQRLPCLYS